jgi:dihydroxyacetone kinase-like protein
MPLDTASIRHAITAIAARLEADHEMLSTLDGKVGDGDLGITLLKAFRELDRIKPDLPDDLGQALMQSASAVSKVSSSSFGTLLATSLMTVAKQAKGTTSVPWSALSGYMENAVAAMSARGKANLGDKTVLDALSASAKAASGLDDPQAVLEAARKGTNEALDAFRDQPNKIGRARIFAERTIGLDDPGMVALKVMLDAL